MRKENEPSSDNPEMTEEDVVAFIKDNPDILERLSGTPPKKKAGSVADFQSYLIERLKSDKEKVLSTTQELVEASRANMTNQQRINAAILRLLEAQNFDDFIHSITMDLTSILDIDIAVLVVEADGQRIPHVQTTGIRIIPEGSTDKWMGDKIVMTQGDINGIEAIYGGGATLVRSQILLRVDIALGTPPAILAFGSRDPEHFQDGQATDQILFLTRVIERCFRLWLGLPQ